VSVRDAVTTAGDTVPTPAAAPAESAEEMGAPTAEMRDVDSIEIDTDLIRRDPGNIDLLVHYLKVWPQRDPIHIAQDGRLLDGDSLRVLAAHKALGKKQILCLVITQ
jgi:hypothetical protein